jgi:hypothetical protein
MFNKIHNLMKKILYSTFVLFFIGMQSVWGQWLNLQNPHPVVSLDTTTNYKSVTTSDGKTFVAYWKPVAAPANFELRVQLIDFEGFRLFGDNGKLVSNTIPQSMLVGDWDITLDTADNLIVVLNTLISPRQVYLHKINLAGDNEWNPAGIVVGNGSFPKVQALKNGEILVSWRPTSQGKAALQLLNAAGVVQWAIPQTISATSVSLNASQTRAFHELSNGDFIVLFTETVGTSNALRMYARCFATGSGDPLWSGPVQVAGVSLNTTPVLSISPEKDTIYLGYTAPSGNFINAYVQRLHPDGTLPWGLNGRDFDIRTGIYQERDISIASEPTGDQIWASCTYSNADLTKTGEYIQKFSKNTGARIFSDSARVLFGLRQSSFYQREGEIRLVKNHLLFNFRQSGFTPASLTSVYVLSLDSTGTVVDYELRIGSSHNITLSRQNEVVNNQVVSTWVENTNSVGYPRIRANRSTCNFPDSVSFQTIENNGYVSLKINYPDMSYYYNSIDFGEGYKIGTNQYYTYQYEGTYDICMKVKTLCNDSMTYCRQIQVECDTPTYMICKSDTLVFFLQPSTCSGKLSPGSLLETDVTCNMDYGVTGPNGEEFGTILTGAQLGIPLTGWIRNNLNDSVCTRPIKLMDDQPKARCVSSRTVYLDSTGTAVIKPEDINNGSFSSCAGGPFLKIYTNGLPNDSVILNCNNLPPTLSQVFLRAYRSDPGAGAVANTPPQGNMATCTVGITVKDTFPAQCVLPPDTTVLCEVFNTTNLSVYGAATFTDNCSGGTVTLNNDISGYSAMCKRGTVRRIWKNTDKGGNITTCEQKVHVLHNQDYFIKFPNDIISSVCSTNTGTVELYGTFCENMEITYTDEIVSNPPDACHSIIRTWKVLNKCTYDSTAPLIQIPNPRPNFVVNHPVNLPGVTVSPVGTMVNGWLPSVVKINPTDPAPTNYGTFWQKEANGYEYVQFIKYLPTADPIIDACPTTDEEHCINQPNDPQLWHNPLFSNPVYGPVDLNDGAVDLTIEATSACEFSSLDFDFELFLDLNGDGTQETRIRMDTTSPGLLRYNNVGSAPGTLVAFDSRNIPSADKWLFRVAEISSVGPTKKARLVWQKASDPTVTVLPRLPLGRHRIKWYAEDQCGNRTPCDRFFVVKDCDAPVLSCLNGLVVGLNNALPTINLWATDYLNDVSDIISPDAQIQLGLRRQGQPDGQGNTTGFPLTASGDPQSGITLNCDNLGANVAELWAKDQAGNTTFCTVFTFLMDNEGICTNDSTLLVQGLITTEDTLFVEDVEVALRIQSPGLPAFVDLVSTDSLGEYSYPSANLPGQILTIAPELNLDPLNGVNTFDLILISRHILGLEPLSTPYKIIAADANRSGTVTTFDIVELRKLILGSYSELPNNKSWRFVDKNQVFSNQDNPFADTIKEVLVFPYAQQAIDGADFIGIKIGDLDNTVTPNNLQSTAERTNGVLLFDLEDRAVTAGETIAVTFTADQVVKGYQFTLNLNGLKVESVTGEGMNEEHFAIFDDAITTSWDAPTVFNGNAAFTVTFTATKSGKLSEMLSVSSRITKALACGERSGESVEKLDVALRFNNGGSSTIAGVGFELYQNTPNPWTDRTVIGFYLPEAGTVNFQLYDMSGKILYRTLGDFSQGHHSLTIGKNLVQNNQVLYYSASYNGMNIVRKMIKFD